MKNKSFILLLIASILFVGSCKKDEEEPDKPTPPYYPNGIGEIGTIGGTVAMDDEDSPFFGAKVIVPEGALDTPVEIEIKLADSEIRFPGDSTQKIYQFLPSGIEFNTPVQIILPFVGDTASIGIYQYIPDQDAEEIIEVEDEAIDFENQRISALTSHFSYYTVWDETVRLRTNMFKTDGNRVCASLDVMGQINSNTLGWAGIVNSLWRAVLTGHLHAFSALSQNSNVYSNFYVDLVQRSGNDIVATRDFSILKDNIINPRCFFYVDGDNDPALISPHFASVDDYEDVDNNIVKWVSGEPLVAVFDEFVPDPDEEYYLKVSWRLEGTTGDYTARYSLSSKDESKLLSQMEYFPRDNFDSNENQIRDEFEDLSGGGGGNDDEPVANFTYSPQNPSIGQSISFTNTSQNFENHLWEFGDGESSEALNPTHSYDTPGTYQVELGVENDLSTDTHTETITVNSGGSAPVAEFEALNPNADVGVDVFFEDQSQNAVSWVWNFGDGTTNDNNDQEPEHTYNAPGTYTVSLTITNQFGEEDTEVKENYITINSSGGNIPVADFEVDGGQTTISLGEFISFNDLSTNDPTEWEWCFDADCNGTSSQQNPTYMYTQAGVYTVSLIASNSDGPSVPEVKTNYITVESDQTYDCPELELNIGDSCDDGDPETTNDTVNENCECEGISESGSDCLEGGTEVVDVTNLETGKTWMDRNLGASQQATAHNDEAAYGDLYQWGRFSDGHQCRDSETTSSISSTPQPGHGDFITSSGSPYDWLNPQNDNLWQGVNGINNPCPEDYRIPTEAELDAERESWSSNDREGAFDSPLKLAAAGSRYYGSGSLSLVGSRGYYWSSTVSGSNARYLSFYSSNAFMGDNYRALGNSVRCIKD